MNNNTSWQPLQTNTGQPPAMNLYGVNDTTGISWADSGGVYQSPTMANNFGLNGNGAMGIPLNMNSTLPSVMPMGDTIDMPMGIIKNAVPDYSGTNLGNNGIMGSILSHGPNGLQNMQAGLSKDLNGIKNFFGGAKDIVSKATTGLGKAYGDLKPNEKFNTLFGGAQTLFGIYSGFKQLGVAKKQMEQQNKQWNSTWNAHKTAVNEGARNRAEQRNNGVKSAVQEDYNRNKIS